jgi:hypothetical protein
LGRHPEGLRFLPPKRVPIFANERNFSASAEIFLKNQVDIVFSKIPVRPLLTSSGVLSITPLTDEGGGAAGDEVTRSEEIAEKLAEMLMGPGYGLAL